MAAPTLGKADDFAAGLAQGVRFPEKFRQATGTVAVTEDKTTRPQSGAAWPRQVAGR